MGTLIVQIGQCGCQIGNRLHDQINTFKESTYLKRIKSNVIHTIMLDTQPKILKPLKEDRKKYSFLDPSNIKYFQYGRGNNWSYGYLDTQKYRSLQKQQQLNTSITTTATFSKPKGDAYVQKYFQENTQIIEFTLDRIRTEIQKTDCFMGVNIISSLGGGTGSGLGTRIVQEIKDNMQIRVITHAVLPNQSGETPLQHYNCALSLASLYQHSDAIFTYQNDKMSELLSLQESYEGSLDQINGYIGHSLASLFGLNDIKKYDRFYFDLVQNCTTNDLKFLELFVSYDFEKKENQKKKNVSSWDDVMNSVIKQVQVSNREQYQKAENKQKTILMQCLAKGPEEPQFLNKYEKKLKPLLNPISSINYQHIEIKGERQCIIVANRTRVLRYLKHIIAKGEQKLRVNAYIWNYKVPLEPAFQMLNNIVENYECI